MFGGRNPSLLQRGQSCLQCCCSKEIRRWFPRSALGTPPRQGRIVSGTCCPKYLAYREGVIKATALRVTCTPGTDFHENRVALIDPFFSKPVKRAACACSAIVRVPRFGETEAICRPNPNQSSVRLPCFPKKANRENGPSTRAVFLKFP